MRDPRRIAMFLKMLEGYWSLCPDLRFGQFIIVVFRKIEDKYGDIIFNLEDDELMLKIEETVKAMRYIP